MKQKVNAIKKKLCETDDCDTSTYLGEVLLDVQPYRSFIVGYCLGKYQKPKSKIQHRDGRSDSFAVENPAEIAEALRVQSGSQDSSPRIIERTFANNYGGRAAWEALQTKDKSRA